jgi:histidinol-phosphate aminotransferase
MNREWAKWVRPNVLLMRGYVPGEQPQGGKFIKLNTNESPYRCSDAVVRAITEKVSGGLQKYPEPSAFAFRSAFASRYGVDPDRIVCGNGSDEILSLLFATFVCRENEVRWPWPTYVLYNTLATIHAAKATTPAFQADWTLGQSFFSKRADVRLVIIANPNSPSGTVLGTEELEQVLTTFRCPVVIDEAYVDFSDNPRGALDLVDRYENAIVTRTLSKSYALAGLRFGWAVAQQPMIEQINKVRDSYNCDALAITGATAAILDEPWLIEHNKKIASTRAVLSAQLTQLEFEVTPSQANFVWCQHARKSSKEIYESLKAAQILVRYMHFDGFGDGLRITVGTDDQISALIGVLKQIL